MAVGREIDKKRRGPSGSRRFLFGGRSCSEPRAEEAAGGAEELELGLGGAGTGWKVAGVELVAAKVFDVRKAA